jgi:regulator of protease activity HflC (stomatin/prohibitin superfamily)
MRRLSLCFVGLLTILVLAGCGLGQSVSPGEVAILVDKAQSNNAAAHYHVVAPGEYFNSGVTTSVYYYPITQQQLTMVRNPNEGKVNGDDSIACNDKNGIPMNVEVTVLWQVIYDPGSKDTGEILALFQNNQGVPLVAPPNSDSKAPVNTNDIEDKIVRPSVRSSVVEACGLHTWDQISAQGPQFNQEITQRVQEKLTTQHLRLVSLDRRQIYFQDAQNQALAKVATAQQAAQAATYAKQQAQNEADGVRAQAQGQADANRILAQSLSPSLIQYEELQKWDGKLPQVTGGSQNGLNLIIPSSPATK